jgi:hypothetical protein
MFLFFAQLSSTFFDVRETCGCSQIQIRIRAQDKWDFAHVRNSKHRHQRSQSVLSPVQHSCFGGFWLGELCVVYQYISSLGDTDPVVRMIQYFDIWYRFFWILIYSDRRTISISHFANCTQVCCLSFAYNPTQVVQTCMNCDWNHSELKLVPKPEIQGIHIHTWY